MMVAAGAIAATLNGILSIAVAERPATVAGLQDLISQGYQVIAEGELFESLNCTRFTMRTLPGEQAPDNCKVSYGRFQRLKNDDNEFVCVSFHDWTCNRSDTRN